MKVAIIQFPGSNCDWDSEHAVKDVLGISTEESGIVLCQARQRQSSCPGVFIW